MRKRANNTIKLKKQKQTIIIRIEADKRFNYCYYFVENRTYKHLKPSRYFNLLARLQGKGFKLEVRR